LYPRRCFVIVAIILPPRLLLPPFTVPIPRSSPRVIADHAFITEFPTFVTPSNRFELRTLFTAVFSALRLPPFITITSSHCDSAHSPCLLAVLLLIYVAVSFYTSFALDTFPAFIIVRLVSNSCLSFSSLPHRRCSTTSLPAAIYEKSCLGFWIFIGLQVSSSRLVKHSLCIRLTPYLVPTVVSVPCHADSLFRCLVSHLEFISFASSYVVSFAVAASWPSCGTSALLLCFICFVSSDWSCITCCLNAVLCFRWLFR
jgi:hypothetical protein